MSEPFFIEYIPEQVANPEEVSKRFYEKMDKRRSLRSFSDRPVSREVIENIIKTAATAPSGAHKQPWVFVAVSDPDIKRRIRAAAEKEEREFYSTKASQQWLDDIAPMGTDWQKPYLEDAPWLIAIFRKLYTEDSIGKRKNYYVRESVGIATGMLLTAAHHAGLCTLIHTPIPMNFLTEILERPENEKPFLMVPVGYAAENAQVPLLKRRSLDEISVFK